VTTTDPQASDASDDVFRALNGAAEAIWLDNHATWPDISVEVLPSIDSTNTALMRRARAGQHQPVVLMAVTQTAGKGRSGKAWESPAGDSLSFSVGLPMAADAPLSGLSLAIGLALAEKLNPRARIKWPNDLWVNQQKLAGILIEVATLGHTRFVVVGVGLNIQTPQLLHPTAAAVPPIGLRDVTGDPTLDIGKTATHCVNQVFTAFAHFTESGFSSLIERYADRDALRDVAVRLSDGTTGTARGVTAAGALRLERADGTMVDIISQEVSVRPCAT
jgi:BirA family biotin operon repressor/biotin-[acetyl-CoA-carboxylase] ligase